MSMKSRIANKVKRELQGAKKQTKRLVEQLPTLSQTQQNDSGGQTSATAVSASQKNAGLADSNGERIQTNTTQPKLEDVAQLIEDLKNESGEREFRTLVAIQQVKQELGALEQKLDDLLAKIETKD